ncbi:MAG: hypothetical protein P1U86_01300 [Verrucomicrobiales bacterium]|nr:hypothetical protein [Verrucomicrobiales bacterium]
MNDTHVRILAVTIVLFFGLMRWAHRSWGKAALSTLFAPLVGIPLAGVTFLGVTILFKLLNGLLSTFDVAVPLSAISFIAGAVTIGITLWLLALYCRDQRHLSLVRNGPGLGVSSAAPTPNGVFRRRFG